MHQPSLQGAPTLSVQWGAWAGGGMAARDRSTVLRVQRMGMGMIEPANGLVAFSAMLSASSGSCGSGVFAAVPFNWPTFIGRLGSAPVPPMFAAFADAAKLAAPPAAAVPARAALRPAARPAVGQAAAARSGDAAAAAAAEAFKQQVATEVAATARSILGADVGSDEPLMAAGLDSLSSVEFRNSLEAKLGLQLPSTLVFDYPTITAIAVFVAANHAPVTAAAEEAEASSAAAPRSAASAAQHLAFIQGEVAEVARSILGADIDPQEPLMAAGLDSLSSVEFRNSLEAKLGLQLPGTLVFDYPSVSAIAQHVSTLLAPAAAAGGDDAANEDLLASLLGGSAGFGASFDVLADYTSDGVSTAVALAALVARQPAGIMAGGDAARWVKEALVAGQQHSPSCFVRHAMANCLPPPTKGLGICKCTSGGASVEPSHNPTRPTHTSACSGDGMAPVWLARWDLDRVSAGLVGGMPYRFTSMLQGVDLFDAAAFSISDAGA